MERSCNYTMASKGVKQVEIAGYGDTRQITAAAMSGEFLPVQLINQRYHTKHKFPDAFDVYHMPNHCSNEESSLRFIEKVIIS